MNEKNELNDIILNKSGSTNSNKKIILAVATLGVILIVVVMLMNSLSSNGTDNLPQAVLPPQPQTVTTDEDTEEPLFEDIEVIEEADTADTDLDMIAQKLKEESLQEENVAPVKKATVEKKKKVVKKESVKKPTQHKSTASKKLTKKPVSTTQGRYYIQVGSFSKYEPNKKFLNSITDLGYKYTYHHIKSLNKVLVGPFKTQKDANFAKSKLRSKVEPGAFLVKL
jgi:DedD protein